MPNMFQKEFWVPAAEAAADKPPNPANATPANEQRQFFEGQDKSPPALPEQVDFTQLLAPSAADKDTPVPGVPSISAVMTDEQLSKVASQVDFSQFVPPTLREQNPEMAQMMTEFGKMIYMTAIKHNAALTDAGLSSYDKRVSAQHQKSLSEFVADTPWREDQLFSRPDVSPVLQPVIKRLRQEYPTATPEWITHQAKQYLVNVGRSAADELGVSLTPPPAPAGQQGGMKIDWLKYANGDGLTA